MSIRLTEQLGAFIAALRPEAVPDAAKDVAALGFTDCVACLIAGRDDPPVRILRDVLSPTGDQATLLFGWGRANAPEAAWINGVAAHAMDFDDTGLKGHPSTVLVPAILAEAEALGSTGAEMATAYVAGYETWAELVRRDNGQHHMKGIHPTSIFGAVGASAACASLRRLDAARATAAIGLGASQAAGLMANFGTMAKPYHAGRAAHAGVMSARLAEAGMTASPDVLEHPRGYLAAYSPKGEIDRDTPLYAGRDWSILKLGLGIKKYPMCYCAHRPLDGVLDLLAVQPVAPEKVERVVVEMSARNAQVLRNHRPQTALEAKFSIEFAMAAAILARRCGLAELQDAYVRRPEVQALMARVEIQEDPREDPFTGYAPFDRITIHASGRAPLVSEQVTIARGNWGVPLARAEVRAKFDGCLEAGRFEGDGAALFEALMGIARLPGTQAIPGLGAAGRQQGRAA
jgi:2-methylcitrate dehydratase PrpD